MTNKERVQYCLAALENAGAQKAQCLLTTRKIHELNVASNTLSLLRTIVDTSLQLIGIFDERQGAVSVNILDQASLDRAVDEVVFLAKSSQPDSAYDIAEFQPAKEFSSGPASPDREKMYARLKAFLTYSQATYPQTMQEEIAFDFTSTCSIFQNSHGVDFVARQGRYNFSTLLASKDGKKTSSLNYSGFSSQQLEQELQFYGSIERLLQQSQEQIATTHFPGKIRGDVIITPDCLGDFIAYITRFLRDASLITGNSIFKTCLGQEVAYEKFTLHSRPVSEELSSGYFFTKDGYEAQNMTIVGHGILNSFLLSLYGARKTGFARAVNEGGAYIVEAGGTPLEKMIASVRQGILLGRFSGGAPSENGDFSGVAKNSYYIENGVIQAPISETMLSGNLVGLLKKIRFISRERTDFGTAIFPWVQVRDITISGKGGGSAESVS